jgi:tRNA(Leu) C34 or U34 (ribose-2'-O)-methylase TrmL
MVTPTIVLLEPRFVDNIAAAVRAASAFDIKQVWYTGRNINGDARRLPRELRMYSDRVDLFHSDKPLDMMPDYAVPVALEYAASHSSLVYFRHARHNVYVFGPERGEVPGHIKGLCHHVVSIPTAHSLNLAATVNIVLYDRAMKREVYG